MHREIFPFSIKIAYYLFMCVLIPVNWYYHGLENLLWFSDVALFLVLYGLVFDSQLAFCIVACGILPFEILWNIDYFTILLFGYSPFEIANYMFDSSLPLLTRGISYFHIWLVVMVLWAVYKRGYDRRAWKYFCVVSSVVLPMTYLLATPEKNINWVRGLGESQQHLVHPLLYLLLVMLFIPFCMAYPCHYLFAKFTRKADLN